MRSAPSWCFTPSRQPMTALAQDAWLHCGGYLDAPQSACLTIHRAAASYERCMHSATRYAKGWLAVSACLQVINPWARFGGITTSTHLQRAPSVPQLAASLHPQHHSRHFVDHRHSVRRCVGIDLGVLACMIGMRLFGCIMQPDAGMQAAQSAGLHLHAEGG